MPYSCHTNTMKHSFFPRTITLWNLLPQHIASSQTLRGFQDTVLPPGSSLEVDKFVNDMIVKRNTPLESPIKNNAFKPFKIDERHNNQRLPYSKQLSRSSANSTLRLLSARRGDTCDLDRRTFIAHVAHSFPRSMASGNELYYLTKSDIIHCFEGKQKLRRMGQCEQVRLIQDGQELIHQLDDRGNYDKRRHHLDGRRRTRLVNSQFTLTLISRMTGDTPSRKK